MKTGTTVLTMPKDKVLAFPLSLPSLDGRNDVAYKRRDARYYSHLASLSSQEFEENRGSKNKFFYTYYLTGLISASLVHAVNLKTSPKNVDFNFCVNVCSFIFNHNPGRVFRPSKR